MGEPQKTAGWTAIRQQIKLWPRDALLGLIKDLHDVSAENRDFLQARFQAGEENSAALERYKKRIVEQFFPKRGDGKLNLPEARKAIRDYAKAAGDDAGVIELMLTFVESGTDFTMEFGDIDGPYYVALMRVLEDLAERMVKQAPALYPRFRERFLKLREYSDQIGWGYGDCLDDRIGFLEEKLAPQ